MKKNHKIITLAAMLAVVSVAFIGLSMDAEESDATTITVNIPAQSVPIGQAFSIGIDFTGDAFTYFGPGKTGTTNYSWASVTLMAWPNLIGGNVHVSGTAPSTSGTYTITYTVDSGSTSPSSITKVTGTFVLTVVGGPQTISFNANGGTGGITSQNVNSGVEITLPWTGMTKAGSYLSGWREGNATTGNFYKIGATYKVVTGTTMYAQWTALPSGSFIDTNAPKIVKVGNTYSYVPDTASASSLWLSRSHLPLHTSPSLIQRTVYSTVTAPAWLTLTTNDGNAPIEIKGVAPSTGIGANLVTYKTSFRGTVTNISWVIIVLPANAVQTTYTVSYDPNVGTGQINPNPGIMPNNSIILPGQQLTRQGYTQVGWLSFVGGTESQFFLGSSFTVKENVTMKARWMANPNIVVFNANGADGGTIDPYIAYTDGMISLPSAGLTRNGYTLEGWYLASDIDAIYPKGYVYTIGNNVTFYAYWVKTGATTINVTINSNGGTGDYTQKIEPGKMIVLPKVGIQKALNLLSGFDLSPGASTPSYNVGATTAAISSTTTFYAVWKDATLTNLYTVSFNLNGGSGSIPPQIVMSGATASVPIVNPEKSASIFRSWYLQNGPEYNFSTPVTADITLLAEYDLHFTFSQVDLTVTLQVMPKFSGNSIITWGDGTSQNTTGTTATHTYAQAMSGRIFVESQTADMTVAMSSAPFNVSIGTSGGGGGTPQPPPEPPKDLKMPIMLIVAVVMMLIIFLGYFVSGPWAIVGGIPLLILIELILWRLL